MSLIYIKTDGGAAKIVAPIQSINISALYHRREDDDYKFHGEAIVAAGYAVGSLHIPETALFHGAHDFAEALSEGLLDSAPLAELPVFDKGKLRYNAIDFFILTPTKLYRIRGDWDGEGEVQHIGTYVRLGGIHELYIGMQGQFLTMFPADMLTDPMPAIYQTATIISLKGMDWTPVSSSQLTELNTAGLISGKIEWEHKLHQRHPRRPEVWDILTLQQSKA